MASRYTLCYIYEPRFELGGGYWPCFLKWSIRIMYLTQFFMLCVFVLREFFYGISTCLAMSFATYRFRVYMSEKERELLRLPLEVAVFLDKSKQAEEFGGDGATMLSKPVYLAHDLLHPSLHLRNRWRSSL